MHKVILVYGPDSLFDLSQQLDRRIGDGVKAARMLDVLELHGTPASVGPWNMIFESIKDQISTYNEHPSLAILHESQINEGEFDAQSLAEFDAVFSYAFDPETGYRLVKLLRPWAEYVGDWWAIGGRWTGLLVPKSPAVDEIITENPDFNIGQAFEEAVGRIFGTMPHPKKMTTEMQRNSLKVGDVNWLDTQVQCCRSVPVDKVLSLTKDYNLKSLEQLFEELYGSLIRDLPTEQRDNFRITKRFAVWEQFWLQFHEERIKTPEERQLAIRFGFFMGYTREQLEAYNEISVYLQAGVVLEGKYFDAEPDPVSADPFLMDDLIALGKRLRDLPHDTVVTVVDLHY